jgi:hypothetical protein
MMAIFAAILAFAMPPSPPVPDTRRNHWVYQGLNLAEGNGLLAGYPKTLPGPDRLMSRYEIAVAYYSAGTRLKDIDASMSKDLQTIATSKADGQEAKDALSELQSFKNAKFDRCIPFMNRAEKEFNSEFKTLGAVPTLITDETKEFKKLSRQRVPKPVM